MDEVDPAKAESLRKAREDFVLQALALERDQIWSVRAWNRIWKKQGLPEHAYNLLMIKFVQQVVKFDKVAKRIFETTSGVPKGFDYDGQMQVLKDAIDEIFSYDSEAERALEIAFDTTTETWKKFSFNFVKARVHAKEVDATQFELDY
jgi:hypothetical protein